MVHALWKGGDCEGLGLRQILGRQTARERACRLIIKTRNFHPLPYPPDRGQSDGRVSLPVTGRGCSDTFKNCPKSVHLKLWAYQLLFLCLNR